MLKGLAGTACNGVEIASQNFIVKKGQLRYINRVGFEQELQP